MEYIELPSSVTEIPTGCFYGCTSLTQVVAKGNITRIGSDAFRGCTLLDFDLPQSIITIEDRSLIGVPFNGVILNLPSLKTLSGQDTFTRSGIKGIESLGEITEFANSVTPGNNGIYPAFYGCTALEYVNLPITLKSVPGGTFYNCTSLVIEDLSLPNLESLGQNAFYGVSIKKISNLGKITALPGASATTQNFGKKDVLEEVVLPDTLTTIIEYSFADYKALTKCNIPDSVTEILGHAFSGCSALYYDNLVLNNVTLIKGYAFSGVLIDKIVLPKIQTFSQSNFRGAFPGRTTPMLIDIGEDCTDLGNYLFSYSSEIGITMICRAGTPPTIVNPFHAGSAYFEVIYVPDASVTAYKEASGWVDYADRIKPISEMN